MFILLALAMVAEELCDMRAGAFYLRRWAAIIEDWTLVF